MKKLIIIGAGGMGKELLYTAENSIGYGTEFVVKGFLDDNIHSMDEYKDNYPPVLSTIHDYQPEEDDVFVCSMGNVGTKRELCELIKAKGGKFQTLIHKDAQIRKGVVIGDGCVIDALTVIGSESRLGENCLVQLFSIIGHDCVIGDYARIDTHSVCVGGVILENNVTIHTGSVVSHNVVVGHDSTVAAMSFVFRKVKPWTTVQGNPAKVLFTKDLNNAYGGEVNC